LGRLVKIAASAWASRRSMISAEPDPHVSDHDRGAGGAAGLAGQPGHSGGGMESTGAVWKPVEDLLEGEFRCWLLNARHLRNVPGRKTPSMSSMKVG
jgi:hypothetical protein